MSSTGTLPRRWPQALLIGSLLGTSWLGMQIVHELGHVLGAWATGGTVVHLELKPWTISQTLVSPNPQPLVEFWAGPIVGALLPVALWLAARAARRSWAYLLRFFAGFCLVANGCYIGCGVFLPVGDAAEILRASPPQWPLGLFGIVATVSGLALWNGLGERFGLGAAQGGVHRRHAVACATLLLVVIALETVL
jgi:hypothetical protein